MAKGSPSLIALLGLLAVAGYQNRDKLSEVLNARGIDPSRPGSPASPLDSLRQMLGGADGGGMISGLSELFERFSNPVQKSKVDTWVQRGPNAPLTADELEEVLDEETLAELGAKTGLGREELLSRLSTSLPEAVDQATPDGQFPPITMPEPRAI